MERKQYSMRPEPMHHIRAGKAVGITIGVLGVITLLTAACLPTPSETVQRGILQATAQAAATAQKDTSFVPTGGFTQEIFDRIRRAAVQLDMRGGGIFGEAIRCSGTIITDDTIDGDIAIVLAKHCATELHLDDAFAIDRITFRRPGIDKFETTLYRDDFALFAHPTSDQMMITFPDAGNVFQDEGIPWQDGSHKTTSQTLLIVGFPGAMTIASPETGGNLLITHAEVITETNLPYTANSDSASWCTPAIMDHGDSGGSVVALDTTGEPFLSDIMVATSDERTNPGKPFGCFVRVDVKTMLANPVK